MAQTASPLNPSVPTRRDPPVFARWVVFAFFILLPCTLLFPVVFGGEAFLPADLLRDLYPWKAGATTATPWNVLRFDGITQFYEWRLIAAQSLHSGHIPLWNPFVFAGDGGTPLLANAQSAPLYPPNVVLFDLFPASHVWRAFGLSVIVHLLVALWGMYRFLRSLPVGRAAAVLGAAVWGLSAPLVTWLSLPTFLCVTCWLPLLLWLIKAAHHASSTRAKRLALAGAGGVGGLVLLAGHLQIAFYVLLAAALYAAFLGAQKPKQRQTTRPGLLRVRWLAGAAAGFSLAFVLALPQLLPSLELSRQSHRASSGGPSPSAYSAYVANALPARNLVTFLAPDFYGNPNKNNGSYWNTNNYAEWAAYVGVLPLVLALFALFLPWKDTSGLGIPKERAFAALLMAVALLLAFGTPLNTVFFWGVPGYNQTGNPARCLVLWAFAAAVLAAIGMEAATNPAIPRQAKSRAALIAFVLPVFLAAIGASLATGFARDVLPGTPFGDLMALALPGVQSAVVWLVLSIGAVTALLVLPPARSPIVRAGCVLVCAADLLAFGVGYNPTSAPAWVFPVTPGLAFLETNGPNALIAPINRAWSLSNMPPTHAVLPPNTLGVYGLHDMGGYDSLFPGAYKERAKTAGGDDPSPPENGNMVFTKSAQAALALRARYLVFGPIDSRIPADGENGLRRVYAGDDMVILENPQGRDAAAPANGASSYAPPYPATAFRLGLWAGLFGVAALAGVFSAGIFTRRRQAPH